MVFVTAPGRHRPRWRWATPFLLCLCVGTYVVAALANPAGRDLLLRRWGALSSAMADWRNLLEPERALSLFTALALHADPLHLLGNMLFLLVFGLPAERALGSLRLLLLFVVGGAVANSVAVLSLDRPDHVVLGASGAVSVLIGAYLALFPSARLGVVLPLGLWLHFVRVPAMVLISLWVVLQLLFTWVGPSFGAVAWWAHLSGFGFGFTAAMLMRDTLARSKRLRG